MLVSNKITMNTEKRKILVVGQTPPPFGGQAVMIENILLGKYEKIELYHVRMAFSKEMNEVGKFNLFKIFHLFEIVYKILYIHFKKGVDVLYFPPTGPNRMPFYRDAFILILVRPFFKKTCLHFHASGISELYPSLDFISRFIFRKSYYYADVGIKLSVSSPDDYDKLQARKKYIIPYGIEDNYVKGSRNYLKSEDPCILFVGLLTESKGPLILIEACNILKKRGLKFTAQVMGKFESMEFEKRVREKVILYDLQNEVTFLGVLTGEAKFNVYAKADIFCFPTYFEAESFPVVLLEASSFALPIVSSQWRGVPSLVDDDKNGFLCPIKDYNYVAQKLKLLIEDPILRKKMGEHSRDNYLNKYSLNRFYENMEEALATI